MARPVLPPFGGASCSAYRAVDEEIKEQLMKHVLLAAALALTCSVAQAQAGYHVSGSKICWGTWTFKAIYSDAGVNPQLHSFLASAPSAITGGDDIVAIWYVRDAGVADGWTTKLWTTTTGAEAMKIIKSSLGIPDEEDDRWELADKSEIDAVLTPEQSKNYDLGLFADDPFTAVFATAPDRDEAIGAIASWGYNAADPKEGKGIESCSSGAVLSALAAGSEADLAQCEAPDKAIVALDAINKTLGATCAEGLEFLKQDATFYVASIEESICDRPNVPIPPWSPVRCTTDRGPYPTSTHYCWTYSRTYTVTRTKTLGKFNSPPPPTYLFCTQTSTATRTDTQTCCSPWYPDPVPGQNPDCEDLVTPPPSPGSPGAPTCGPVRSSYPLQGAWSPNPCSPWRP